MAGSVALLVVAAGTTAQASSSTSTAAEVIVVEGQRARPAGWLDDRTAAAETIRLGDRLAPNESLGDVLSEASGVRVRRSGGEGAFEGLSIRGSEPNHTVVLLGDLPILGTDRGAIDLSLLPLQAFGRVEIFRGSAPAWLDQGQIGGVVRLVPREAEGDEVRAQAGAGSFGGLWSMVDGSLRGASTGLLVAAGARTRANDYGFIDDGATVANPNDDQPARRQNADVQQAHGFTQLDWQEGGHRLDLIALGVHRARGEPGPGHRQTEQASRTQTQVFGTLGYRYEAPDSAFKLQAAVTGGWDRDAFDDSLGELGQSEEETDDRFMALGGRLAASVGLADWLEGTVATAARYDRYEPENAFAVPGDQPSDRATLRATVEARVHSTWGPVAFEVRPSASFMYSDARLVRRNLDELEARRATESLPAFRVGLFVSPQGWLSLQGSVGIGNRLPTVLELFGNRGNLLANPTLRPERALNWDAGAIAAGRRAVAGRRIELRLEARAFGSQTTDLIRYRTNGQYNAIAENIESGSILGFEGAVRIALPSRLSLDGQAAWLQAEDNLGRGLPLRPRWTGRFDAEGSTGPIAIGWLDDIRAGVAFTYIGRSWTDPANLVELPDRGTWSVRIVTEHWRKRVQMSFSLRDVFDVGGIDLLGFPLPGRRFDVALTWTEILN